MRELESFGIFELTALEPMTCSALNSRFLIPGVYGSSVSYLRDS